MSGNLPVPAVVEGIKNIPITNNQPQVGDTLMFSGPAGFVWTPVGTLSIITPNYGTPGAQMIVPIGGTPRGLTIKAGTFVKMPDPTTPGNFYVYSLNADMVINDAQSRIDVGGSFGNGQDWYVYLVTSGPNNAATQVSISQNPSQPQGATTSNSLMIGGFHTLCTSVGTGLTYVLGDQIVSHDLNGFLAGDILPLSVWDLKHRPKLLADQLTRPGMVFEKRLGFWVDIYLQSGQGATTASAYQGPIANMRQYVEHVEDMFSVGKTLLSDEEFAAAALGSNEQTNVAGSSQAGAQNGGAGGRVDTAGRRMISYCGCEEMCGSMLQWLRSDDASGYGQSIYGMTVLNPPTYAGFVTSGSATPQAGGKGSMWSAAGALMAGGGWSNGADCGSRARNAINARSNAGTIFGGRGRVPSSRD